MDLALMSHWRIFQMTFIKKTPRLWTRKQYAAVIYIPIITVCRINILIEYGNGINLDHATQINAQQLELLVIRSI